MTKSPASKSTTPESLDAPKRQRLATGSPWEGRVGYSRAVRIGHHVFVAGTIAVNERGELIGGNDPHAQTVAVLEKIKDALEQMGASLDDVVRTRLFVIDIDQWEVIGQAHAAYFSKIRPCATMVEVSRLALPGALIEVEADAVIAAG